MKLGQFVEEMAAALRGQPAGVSRDKRKTEIGSLPGQGLHEAIPFLGVDEIDLVDQVACMVDGLVARKERVAWVLKSNFRNVGQFLG